MKESKKGRWLEMRSDSNWHFDLTKPPEHGKDSYTHICRFNYDFTNAIKACNNETVVSILGGNNDNILEPEQIDLINAGANPHPHNFNLANNNIVKKIKIFQKISDYLGLIDSKISYHNQTWANGAYSYGLVPKISAVRLYYIKKICCYASRLGVGTNIPIRKCKLHPMEGRRLYYMGVERYPT